MLKLWRWFGLFGWVLSATILFQDKADAFINLSSSVSISEQYNDNFFFTENSRETEYTTIVSPRLALKYGSRNLTIKTNYQGVGEIQARHSEKNHYGHIADLTFDLPFLTRNFKGLTVEIKEKASLLPELPTFEMGEEGAMPQTPTRSTLGNEGIAVGRSDSFKNDASIELKSTLTEKVSVSLYSANNIVIYKSPNLQDSHRNTVRMGWEYQQLRRTLLTTSYGISIIELEDAGIFNIYNFHLGAKHVLNRTLSFSGDIGAEAESSGPNRITLNAGVIKALRTGFSTVQYNSGIGSGGGTTSTPTFFQTLRIAGTWNFQKNSSVSVNLDHSRNKTLSAPFERIITYNARIALLIPLLKWLNASLVYDYLSQESEGSGIAAQTAVNADRNTVLLSLNILEYTLNIF